MRNQKSLRETLLDLADEVVGRLLFGSLIGGILLVPVCCIMLLTSLLSRYSDPGQWKGVLIVLACYLLIVAVAGSLSWLIQALRRRL